MAYAPHTLVAFGGRLTEVTANDEVWECTVRGMSAAGGSPLNAPIDESGLDQYLSEIAAPLSAWFSAATSHHGGTLEWVKANNIGADGKYTSPTTHVHDYAPVVAGAATGSPTFLSIAISWRTGRTRPPGAHGRIYPPNYPVGANVGTSVVPASTVTQLVSAGQSLLTLLANRVNADHIWFAPEIVSKINAVHEPITAVFVGNVMDVQRRRKNATKETYSGGPWSP